MSISLWALTRRQHDCDQFSDPTCDGSDLNNDDPLYYSDSSQRIRYGVGAAILAIVILWVFGGMFHANRRARKGLPLLWYHRWLGPSTSRRRTLYAVPPPGTYYPQYPGGQAGQQYQMNDWTHGHAPPSYNHDAPPAYQPPPGGSKIDPSQTIYTTPVQGPQGPLNSEAPSSSSMQPPPQAHTNASHQN